MKITNHKVVSDKQLAASRRNAKRSTGSRPADGWAASKFNAIKHSMLSKSLPFRGIGDADSDELDHICAASKPGDLCQTNPFLGVRVPPSGSSGARPTTHVQTNPHAFIAEN